MSKPMSPAARRRWAVRHVKPGGTPAQNIHFVLLMAKKRRAALARQGVHASIVEQRLDENFVFQDVGNAP